MRILRQRRSAVRWLRRCEQMRRRGGRRLGGAEMERDFTAAFAPVASWAPAGSVKCLLQDRDAVTEKSNALGTDRMPLSFSVIAPLVSGPTSPIVAPSSLRYGRHTRPLSHLAESNSSPLNTLVRTSQSQLHYPCRTIHLTQVTECCALTWTPPTTSHQKALTQQVDGGERKRWWEGGSGLQRTASQSCSRCGVALRWLRWMIGGGRVRVPGNCGTKTSKC